MVILKAFVKLAAGAGPWAAAAGSVAVVCLWVSVDHIAARPAGGTVVKLNRASVRWAAPNMSVDLPSDIDRPPQNSWRGNGWSYDLPDTVTPIPGSAVYSAIESVAAVLDDLETPHRTMLAFDPPLPLPLPLPPSGEPAGSAADATPSPSPDSSQTSAAPAPFDPGPSELPGSAQIRSSPGSTPSQPVIAPTVLAPITILPLFIPVQPWAVTVPSTIVAGDLPDPVPEPSSLVLLASLALPLAAWRKSRFGKLGWRRGRRQRLA